MSSLVLLQPDYAQLIADRLQLPKGNVGAILKLLDEGATVPFISRYRKELIGEIDEVGVDRVKAESELLIEQQKRKTTIWNSIEEQGKLTLELAARINSCFDANELEDIYLPFKPRRRTRATVARELGLEPLAKMIMSQRLDNPQQAARAFVKPGGAESVEQALSGASDIIAEWVSENETARNAVRRSFNQSAVIRSKVVKGKEDEGQKYRDYFNCEESLRRCAPHRYLAMRRAEAEGVLKVGIDVDTTDTASRVCRAVVRRSASPGSAAIVNDAATDSCKRLIIPSIENETASAMKQKCDAVAIDIFADGLRQVLMQPPLGTKRVMGIDPGYRTGCKVVCIDDNGNLLCHDVIYPTAPRMDIQGAADKVTKLLKQYSIDAIALGNGTASRETADFLRAMPLPDGVELNVVSEQGASIYSASAVARQEFPDEDVTVRGAVSIARRLLDPLAELVKIDPKSIGVGQYQHDVDQKALRRSLDFVVESCVNQVGVNLNSASRQLLSYVSGIGDSLAANIVEYRAEHGGFSSRSELKKVPRLGEKAFAQCAGFIRVPESDNPLDNSAVHPERYKLVERMAADLGCSVARLIGNQPLISKIDVKRYVGKDVGLPTLLDIIDELKKPGRDPRCRAEQIDFAANIREITDLWEGMELEGKVTNITAFGAFVEFGIKENGLVHVSQMADRFISSPSEVVKIGQHVRVKVLEVDLVRHRISLTMKGLKQ